MPRFLQTYLCGLAAVATLGLTGLSAPAHADQVRCTIAKVTSIGMGSRANTRNFLGEAVTFDTARNAVKVEWERGTSDWIPAEEKLSNNRFVSYAIFEDIEFRDGMTTVKIIFRLYNDGSKAEIRSEPQKNAGGGRDWKQNAARYACG
ncbi:MAG: hypothetical protein AAF727_00790 [Pseudomonadota bacterium]